MNLPNKLTVLRMIMVPFFVLALLWPFPHHYLVALALFGIASYTDHLDGKLARKYHQITDFGKVMRCMAGIADYCPGIYGHLYPTGSCW